MWSDKHNRAKPLACPTRLCGVVWPAVLSPVCQITFAADNSWTDGGPTFAIGGPPGVKAGRQT